MKKNRPLHLEIQRHRKSPIGVIRSSYREDGRVKHRVYGRLTGLTLDRLEIIQAAFRGDVALEGTAGTLKIKGSKEYGASAALLALARELGLPRMLYSRMEPWVRDALAMIVGRVVFAGSKLALSHQWRSSALWELCGVEGSVDVNQHCYAAMDRLLERQKAVERALAARHLSNSRLVLYDITSSYFEGRYEQSDIVLFGYNRDGKRGHEQMVVALVTNEDGCPVGVEVFPGNTQDASTVPAKIEQIQREYGVRELIFVGDRGMVTRANAEKVEGTAGLNLISALTHRQIVELLERKVIQLGLFDDRRVVEVTDPEDATRRYELCRNPESARRETATRRRLLDVTRKELDTIAASRRKVDPERLGGRVGRVLERYKMGKFVEWRVVEGRLEWHFLEDKIESESMLDGCYIIVTDASPETLDSEEVVAAYKSLRHVETAFRNLKTVRLEMRPVYHKTDDRIRAHVFICMLAYYLQWHMRQRLSPLFDADGAGGKREWTFANVIERLKAIRWNNVVCGKTTFRQISEPEDDQQRILDLLEVKL
jgi:transposase